MAGIQAASSSEDEEQRSRGTNESGVWDKEVISAAAMPVPDDLEKGEQGAARDDSDNKSLGHQTNVLSSKQLFVAFPALSLALFVSFIDQTSVSTSIPSISSDLNAGASTSWVGSSFLIASTAFQLINGRLSDIFGRKICLLVCLGLLALGDLLCGFATTDKMLFVFRAIAGIGAGGVNSIAMIIVSDITTLENRGKFQGILGAVIALANGIGPFIGGVLVEKASWRWVMWIIPPLTVPAMVVIAIWLPLKHDSGDYVAKIKKIDFIGVILNIAAVLLILVSSFGIVSCHVCLINPQIPLSGGGATYEWNSPFVIAMMSVGGVLAALFVLYEWKLAPIPIMPCSLHPIHPPVSKINRVSTYYQISFLWTPLLPKLLHWSGFFWEFLLPPHLLSKCAWIRCFDFRSFTSASHHCYLNHVGYWWTDHDKMGSVQAYHSCWVWIVGSWSRHEMYFWQEHTFENDYSKWYC